MVMMAATFGCWMRFAGAILMLAETHMYPGVDAKATEYLAYALIKGRSSGYPGRFVPASLNKAWWIIAGNKEQKSLIDSTSIVRKKIRIECRIR